MNNLMRRSGIIAVLCVLLCLCLLVCSCNNGGEDETTPSVTDPVTDPVETPAESEPDESEPEDTTPEVESVTYTVTVKNAAGEGIANVSVQLCQGTKCNPGTTNASGVATFTLPEAVYQANINVAVDGYVVDTTKYYDFEADATTLTITLEAAPAENEGVIDLKGEDYYLEYVSGSDMAEMLELLLGEQATDGLVYPDMYAYGELAADEFAAGESVVYTYEATADGIVFAFVSSLDGTIAIKNVTTGVEYLPVTGYAVTQIPTTAGNTYEITVDFEKAEEAAYAVLAGTAPDGSKERPYVLTTGTVATEVVIPEGETVWCVFEDSYLLIEDVSVKVTVDGVIWSPDENGEIELGSGEQGLIGITSSEANDKVVLKLSGSDEMAPIIFYKGEEDSFMSVEISEKAAALVDTVYCAFVSPCDVYNLTVAVEGESSTVPNLNARYYTFDVSAIAGTLSVSYVDLNPLGSQNNPINLTGDGFVMISADTIAANTRTHPYTGMTQCAIYYTYTATADCTLSVTVSQPNGAGENDINGWMPTVNGENAMWNQTDDAIILEEDDVVVIMVQPCDMQRLSGVGFDFEMTVTPTAPAESEGGNA